MADTTPHRYGLSRRAAAQRIREKHGLPCTEATLANMAGRGNGPVYRLIAARAYYLPDDIDSWAEARIGPLIRRAADARSAA